MNRKTYADLRAHAESDFKRLIGYTFIAAIVTVIAALFYLQWNDALSVVSAIVTSVAVFLSIMLGAGLMAMGFFSSNMDHDDVASGRSPSKASKIETDD